MEFLILLVIIAIFAGVIFIKVKMNNLKYRAKQQILQGTGLSTSDMSAGFSNLIGEKATENFLSEHPNYTKESVNDLLRQYTVGIFNRTQSNAYSQGVVAKMQTDTKLDGMQTMAFRRANIISYGGDNPKTLKATVVFSDGRDEYDVYLTCSVVGDAIQVVDYEINKGAAVGL